MKKATSIKSAIALCAVAIISLNGATARAGLLDQIGGSIVSRHGGHPEPGDDRGGRHGGHPEPGDDRGGLRGGHGIDDSSSTSQGRRRGGGGGGRDDAPGHH